MGNFLQAVHVRHPDDGVVKQALQTAAAELRFRCWVAPRAGRWVTIFPDADISPAALARFISQQLRAEVLATLVHDSDVFCYTLARVGVEVDDFASNPEYFHEAPLAVRQRACGQPESIVHLLEHGFTRVDLDSWFSARASLSPEALMSRLHELFGIGAAPTSYEYLERGEREGINGWSRFFHVPDLAAEKAAQKALRTRITNNKRALVERRVLLFDSTMGRSRKPFEHLQVHAAHPAGGFVCSHFEGQAALAHWHPPQAPRILERGPRKVVRFGAYAQWLDAETLVVETEDGRCAANVQTGEQRPFHPNLKASLVAVDQVSATGYFVTRSELLGVELRTGVPRFKAVHEFSGFSAVIHPRQPHLVVWMQSGLRIFEKFTGEEIARLKMTNPANVDRRAAQWQAKGIDPATISGLASESLLALKLTPDGEHVLVGTTEGLRIYRYDQLVATHSCMPSPAFAIETTLELQDYRWVHAVEFDAARDVVIFSRGDDSLHALLWSSRETRELSPAMDRARVFQLVISGDVLATRRRGYLDLKRREDEFSCQIWSIAALLDSQPRDTATLG